MKITKMHGLGNSQIILTDLEEDLRNETGLEYNQIALGLAHQGFGVGSDQILYILPSDEADYRMRIFNRDGTEAEMCGNGIRCVGKYLYDQDMVGETFSIETLGGIKTLEIIDKDRTLVKVDMGYGEIKESNKEVLDYSGSTVSVGNPHFVIFDSDSSKEMARKEGPKLENADEFSPEKINVEFANLVDEGNIELYVWERGAGLTLACGTGACATAYLAHKERDLDSVLNVDLLGGTLKIKIEEDDRIFLIGPAEYVFSGDVKNISNIYSNVSSL